MNINVNIEQYTDAELEALFQVAPGYTVSHIINAESSLYIKLLKTVKDVESQQSIAKFLNQVTQRLTKQIVSQTTNQVKQEKQTKHILTINSENRLTGQKIHDFMYTFPESFRSHSLQIESIDIPVYWNEFNQASFYWNDVIIPIPDGNYSPLELETLFQTTTELTLRIRSHTILSSPKSFTIEFGNGINTAGWNMGFRRESYKGEYNALTSMYEIHSEAPYVRDPIELLYVEIYDYLENFSVDKLYLNNKHIMGCFPVINQQRIQCYNFQNQIRTYDTTNKIERLRIRLFNKLGEPFLLKSDFLIQFSILKA